MERRDKWLVRLITGLTVIFTILILLTGVPAGAGGAELATSIMGGFFFACVAGYFIRWVFEKITPSAFSHVSGEIRKVREIRRAMKEAEEHEREKERKK